jgi:hypothetical protein
MTHLGVQLLTHMAVVKPDPVAVVLAVAFHGVVGEVTLRHFKVWIDHNLKGWNVKHKR